MNMELNEKLSALWNSQSDDMKTLLKEMVHTDKNKVRELMYELMETETAKRWNSLDGDMLNKCTDEAMEFLASQQ